MDDLGLCVNAKDVSQERAITDPSLSGKQADAKLLFPIDAIAWIGRGPVTTSKSMGA